jgi:hypothetical protein
MFKSILLIIFTSITLLIIASVSTDRVFPWNESEAIKTAISWSGLTSLPSNSDHLKVWKKGSAFSREFIIKFHSDAESIRTWIHANPRLDNNNPINLGAIKKYEIRPGENGAIGGDVTIDSLSNQVTIDISWS